VSRRSALRADLRRALDALGEACQRHADGGGSDTLIRDGLIQRCGWATDEAQWFRVLEARNLCSHTYSEPTADEVARAIPAFLPALRALAATLPAADED
jgi:Nucleotidyltransferase substrate binding protein like